MNREADESDHQLRVSVDTKATVKIGEFSRGGTCRVKVAALDHDYQADATLAPIGILAPKSGLSTSRRDQHPHKISRNRC